eukprot:5658168-Amphidinium_carterae.4
MLWLLDAQDMLRGACMDGSPKRDHALVHVRQGDSNSSFEAACADRHATLIVTFKLFANRNGVVCLCVCAWRVHNNSNNSNINDVDDDDDDADEEEEAEMMLLMMTMM